MKVIAIISEYNPFHNGHAHMIREVRRAHGDCAVAAIMSGDFVQRGDAAVIGKYARAEAALRCGCDLVLELPAPWCFSGAEFFARGGVGIAAGLGCTDVLAFGAECSDTALLIRTAARLDSDEFLGALAAERESRPGANMAKLRADVYADLYGDALLFAGSNNLLALEYLRALRHFGSGITPFAVRRIGGEFNGTELAGIASATAIRTALAVGQSVAEYLPGASFSVLSREMAAGRVYDFSRLDVAVAARLRTAAPEQLQAIMEISGGMENRLTRAAREWRTVDDIVDACAERRYSKSRLRRAILAALLGVTMDMAGEDPRFTVLLAANSRGREVLAASRKSASIAILSKSSQIADLSGVTREQYELHSAAMALAELCCGAETEIRRAYME